MSRFFRLGDFRIIEPRYQRPQEDALEWLAEAHLEAERRRSGEGGAPAVEQAEFRQRIGLLLRRFGCSPRRIARRGTELEDYTHRDWSRMRIFDPSQGPSGAGMARRLEFFQERAREAFGTWYRDGEPAPAELIHVSCTGYVAPSAAQERAAALGWTNGVRVTHAYHMGCYAALPAIRLATGALALPESTGLAAGARVDVAHTELCTLHLNPSLHDPEQLVVQSLFADGFIRYSVADADSPDLCGGFRILGLRESLIPGSAGDMTWVPQDWGMAMTLSKDVPEKIAGHLGAYLEALFGQAGLDYGHEKARTIFAIHPGGPRIIDGLQEKLGLAEAQVAFSRAVLLERGNLSSATLPHVWQRIEADSEVPAGTRVVSLAFGPGLTIAGGLFEKAGRE